MADGTPRRIAYVLSLKGGIPSFNYRELEAVEKAGWEVSIFPTKVSHGLYDPKPGWKVHEPSAPRMVLSAVYWMFRSPRRFGKVLKAALSDHALPEFALSMQFSREMKAEGARRIHCHFADRKMFTTYFCSVLTGLPYTVTLHSHELTFYSKRPLFRKALQAAEKVVTVCDFNRKLLMEMVRLPDDKVETVRLTVPSEDFTLESRMRVLTVAKFFDYKGYDVLVEAARIMKDDQVVFWIVGDGPVPVAQMAADLVRSGKVRILGPVSEEVLKILYQACDVFCLPSKTAPSGQREGLPVSLMEAMAMARPVVSTRHAGIPELVDKILVDENDPAAVAQALRTYAASPLLRASDGRSNRERVLRMHGPENTARLLKLFEGPG